MTGCWWAVNLWPVKVLTLDSCAYAGQLLETFPTFPGNKVTSFLLAEHPYSTTVLVMCLHRLAPTLHSGFVTRCHLEKPLELLGKESEVKRLPWTVSSRSRATPLLVPKRGWKLPGNYCPWVLHPCTGCVTRLQPCLTLWGPLRLSSPFPPSAPLEMPPAKSPVISPARGGQSAWKGGITIRLEAQVEPTEAIQHPAGTTTAASASGLHLWCLLFFSFLAMSPLFLFFSCEGGNVAYEHLFVVPAVHTAA